MNRFVVVALALCGLLVAAAGTVWAVSSSRGADREEAVVATADSFQAPGGWTTTDRDVEGARLFCAGGSRCPNVKTTYGSDAAMTAEEFQKALDDSGWDLTVEGTCQLPANVTGAGPVCSAQGKVDGFDIFARQELTTAGGASLSITVE